MSNQHAPHPGENERISECIGLLPAAGRGERIAPLPCSKELFPVGFRAVDGSGSLRPKVVAHYLLESMRLAGIRKVYVVLRDGKWDIPAYFGDGSWLDMDLAYLLVRVPFGAPYTVDQAYPFVSSALVAFGFPDIVFRPEGAYTRLIERHVASGADLVVGLFPAPEPRKVDMVDLDDAGRVRSITPRPHDLRLPYTWIIAVWTPVFSGFLHQYLAAPPKTSAAQRLAEPGAGAPELSMGHVLQAAILHGLRVEGVTFPDGRFRDIGTPDDLVQVVRDGA